MGSLLIAFSRSQCGELNHLARSVRPSTVLCGLMYLRCLSDSAPLAVSLRLEELEPSLALPRRATRCVLLVPAIRS